MRQGAEQEINIATRQREAIAQGVGRKGEDGCGVELFKEAEREVLQLIETNVFKAMHGTAMQRLRSWVLTSMPMKQLTPLDTGEEREEGSGSGPAVGGLAVEPLSSIGLWEGSVVSGSRSLHGLRPPPRERPT